MHPSVYYSRALVLQYRLLGMSKTAIAHQTNLSIQEVTTILREAKEEGMRMPRSLAQIKPRFASDFSIEEYREQCERTEA